MQDPEFDVQSKKYCYDWAFLENCIELMLNLVNVIIVTVVI